MDEEAAQVVRKIFQWTIDGFGPYQISRLLKEAKVEIPAVHMARNGQGLNKTKTFGKHGVYDVKHNDRDFDVENGEHIDAERTKDNVYWDCYQGYSFVGSSQERQFTFTEAEHAYYFEHYSDHVDAKNERNEMARNPERNRTLMMY